MSKTVNSKTAYHKDGLLGSFYIQNPQVHVLYIQFLQKVLHWEALHCRKVTDSCLVIIDSSVPLLNKGRGHEFYESTDWDYSLARVVQ